MLAFILENDVCKESFSIEAVRDAYLQGRTVWVDLEERTEAKERMLLDLFGIHALTVDDIWNDREQPKVEDFGGYIHIIAHTVRIGQDPTESETVELDLLIGQRFVLSHHRDAAAGRRVRTDISRLPKLMARGPAFIAYAMLDAMVEDYLPLIDRYDAEIDRIEDEVIAAATTGGNPPEMMARIFALKRALQSLRRTSIHQRELLMRLSRAEFDEIPAEAVPFFRDVYDHFVNVTDLVESYREILSSALDAFLNIQSNRMNEVMKTLTMMSTIMLPLTFIAGVYGMNFDMMPEIKWHYGYPMTLGLMGLVAILIILYFRRKHWL